MRDEEASARSDWWHILLFMPLAILLGGLIGGMIGVLLVGFTALLYPVAMYKDVRWVRAQDAEWTPGLRQYVLMGVLVLFTAGLLSLILSPYYLYKRRKYS